MVRLVPIRLWQEGRARVALCRLLHQPNPQPPSSRLSHASICYRMLGMLCYTITLFVVGYLAEQVSTSLNRPTNLSKAHHSRHQPRTIP